MFKVYLPVAAAALIAVLALGEVGHASALSGMSFTSKPTFNSQSSNRFQTVYFSQDGTGTYFIDSNTTKITINKVNSTGSITYTRAISLQGTGASAISKVEFNNTATWIYAVQYRGSYIFTIARYDINSGTTLKIANVTVQNTGETNQTPQAVIATKNAVYWVYTSSGLGYLYGAYVLKNLAGFFDQGRFYDVQGGSGAPLSCGIGSEGAGVASDVIYCLTANNGAYEVFRFKSNAWAVYQKFSGTSGYGDGIVTETNSSLVLRGTATVPFTYTLTKSNGAISANLFNYNWNTQPLQTWSYNNVTGVRTFIPSAQLYLANAVHAVAFAPDTGALSDPAQGYLESANNGTGALTLISSAKYYRLSDTLIVAASGTTWTPKVMAATTTMNPTIYDEKVSVQLLNNRTILDNNVTKINCDAAYLFRFLPLYTGASGDCLTYQTGGTSADTIGRKLNFPSTSVVHANPISAYVIQVISLNPTSLKLSISYNGVPVDSATFPANGAVNQYLLFGNCYTATITNVATGATVTSTSICADSVTTKTISTSGLTLPTNWLGTTWSYQIQRYFDNSSAPIVAGPNNNQVIFTFQKSVNPYNASIHVVNTFFSGSQTLNIWFNYTNVSGLSVLNMSGLAIPSTMSLYFSLYENGALILTATSAPQSFPQDTTFNANQFGLWFGVPAAWIIPPVVAAIFPKSIAYFGAIVAVAVVGLMTIFGYLTVPFWYWPIEMPITALAVFTGYKRT